MFFGCVGLGVYSIGFGVVVRVGELFCLKFWFWCSGLIEVIREKEIILIYFIM